MTREVILARRLSSTFATPESIDVEQLCRRLGLRLVYKPFSFIVGVLIRTGDGAWAGIDSRLPLGRKRFTIAHELGHYLLHDGCHTDSFDNAQPTTIEREANRFASELLMPESLVVETVNQFKALGLKTVDLTKEIAWAFKVSPSAMSIQLKRLGFL